MSALLAYAVDRGDRILSPLGAWRREGSLASVTDRLAGFDVRQRAVAKPKYDELERRCSLGPKSPSCEAGE
jgi:hypothetical protein